jgi:probable rRNA maturation factor
MKIIDKNIFIERKGRDIPNLPYKDIKEKILGRNFNLNVIFCSPLLSQTLNNKYRGKDYPTNILSFPLSETEGEIYIQLSVARGGAKAHNMSYNEFIHLLFIHGCLHLLNHEHGSEMEKLEDKYMKMYYNVETSKKGGRN